MSVYECVGMQLCACVALWLFVVVVFCLLVACGGLWSMARASASEHGWALVVVSIGKHT